MRSHQTRAIILTALILALAVSPAVLAVGQGYGPGRVDLEILAGRDHVAVGTGGIWNSRDQLIIQLDPADGWRIQGYHVDMGGGEDYSPPLTATGNPKIGHFLFKEEFTLPYENEAAESEDCLYRRTLTLSLSEDLMFQWGEPWEPERLQGAAIFLSLVKLDDAGNITDQTGAWAVPELIVWIEELEEEGEVEEDEVVADEDTGEVTAEGTEQQAGGRGRVNRAEHQNAQRNWDVDEAEEVVSFEGGRWGWWFRYQMAHPRRGHFIDSPVAGLHAQTPTYEGVTDIDAAFDYFPGELVDLSIGEVYLGTAPADHKISPIDIFEISDTGDNRVANLARLLQTLDVDGQAQGGINITEEIAAAFEQAVASLELEIIDFSDDAVMDLLIERTIEYAALMDPPVILTEISAEDAIAHLTKTLDNNMFRKNVSKSPELASSKAKMNIMTVWLPALRANGDPATCEDDGGIELPGVGYYDESGAFIRNAEQAKPIIVTYTDADPETGEHDVWAAVSRDDGNTWKRKNISRMAYRSSFELADGTPYYGGCKKPVFQVKGNKILVAWSSKYARGGKPGYSLPEFLPELDENGVPVEDADGNPIYTDTPNPYYQEDIWGVAGPQRSHDYTEEGFPEVGEVPHAALWVARGIILTPKELNPDPEIGLSPYNDGNHSVGDIVWYKPERLTSGRRDVNQIFCGAASGAGFALVWQEDPNGVKPGKAVGPGPGWGGATTSHKTDIWYSFIKWGDHSKVDEDFVIGGDPEHNVTDGEEDEGDETFWFGRPKALVPMSLPVRLSDNDVVNTDNIMVELNEAGYPVVDPAAVSDENPLGYIPELNPDANSDEADGTHAYAYRIPGLIDVNNVSGAPADINVEGFYEFVNNQEATKHVAITEDGRLLDGDTGASRGNIFLQPYVKTNGKTSAWAIITYEETKGAGAGPPEHEDEDGDGVPDQDGTGDGNDTYVPEEGKNVIYHSFDFTTPDVVSAGTIINRPEVEYIEADLDIPALAGGTLPFTSRYLDRDLDGNPIINPRYLVEEDGVTQILDYLGRPQLAYENARRGRFILQGYGALGPSRTSMIMVYKEGEEGHGRPSDIMMRRWVVPTVADGFNPAVDNPYDASCLVGEYVLDGDADGDGLLDEFEVADLTHSQQWYWKTGPVNVSSVSPRIVAPSQGDTDQEDSYGAIKVVEWDQSEDNFLDLSATNPRDDARAHRGQIRGDFVSMGFSYTPNWAAARNGNDKYDFYVRRSFDGGQTWTTDPSPLTDIRYTANDADETFPTDGMPEGGYTVMHSITWTHPSGETGPSDKVTEWFYYGPGQFERMRNLSQLSNAKSSVIEPRLVAVPGTIKVNGVWTGNAEDKQDNNVFYVAYGTSTNPKKDPETGEQEEPTPEDLFYSFSQDRGENYWLDTWVVNPDSDGNNAGQEVTRWAWMAKGDPEQGEVQLRMTPNGERFYATWLDEGEEGSDIVFRRICPPTFPGNVLE
jgi:hypothetical protein